MKTPHAPIALALCLFACGRGEDPSAPPAFTRPHIVLIVGDDMGFSDLGCFGSEIATPHLDTLAANGTRMTQFYGAGRCCPSRAALMTGRYPHQAGMGSMTTDLGVPGYRGTLSPESPTIAEALAGAGYAAYMSGKWHLTGQFDPAGPKDSWPLARGFDRFYGTIHGAGSHWDPVTLCRGESYITPENDPLYRPEQFFYTDAITDNAATFVRDHLARSTDDPLFLYVAYDAAHWPLHAPEEAVGRLAGHYDAGPGRVRANRDRRARELGVANDAWTLPSAVDPGDSTVDPAWEARNMEVYAAMVERMDAGVGRIVAELDAAGVLDDTLILYVQDNGASAETVGRTSNGARRPTHAIEPLGPNELQTKLWPSMQTRDGRWVRTGPEVLAGPADTYIAYGPTWAEVSNTPLRGFKGGAFEGGLASPLIAHWPAGWPAAARGAVSAAPAHMIDVLPTLLEVAAADPSGHDVEGQSLLGAWRGAPLERSEPIGFEHEGHRAIRLGRWKAVSPYEADMPRAWHLYDLDADRTEQHDLAAAHPDRLTALTRAWDAWAKRVGVREWPL